MVVDRRTIDGKARLGLPLATCIHSSRSIRSLSPCFLSFSLFVFFFEKGRPLLSLLYSIFTLANGHLLALSGPFMLCSLCSSRLVVQSPLAVRQLPLSLGCGSATVTGRKERGRGGREREGMGWAWLVRRVSLLGPTRVRKRKKKKG